MLQESTREKTVLTFKAAGLDRQSSSLLRITGQEHTLVCAYNTQYLARQNYFSLEVGGEKKERKKKEKRRGLQKDPPD